MIAGEGVLLSNISHIPYGRVFCLVPPRSALVVAACDGNCPDIGVPKCGCLPELKKKLLIVAHVAVTALTVSQLVYSADDLVGQIL